MTSLVTSAFAYLALVGPSPISRRLLGVLGILLGLGLALKFTIAPLGVAIVLVIIIKGLLSDYGFQWVPQITLLLRNTSYFIVVRIASFLVFTFPVARHLSESIGRLRIESSHSVEHNSVFIGSLRFLKLAPEFSILIIIALAGFGVLIGLQMYVSTSTERKNYSGSDMLAVGPAVMLVATLLIFGFILVRIIGNPHDAEYVDSGVLLRNITPIAGFLPLVLLLVWRVHILFWRRFSDSKFRRHAMDAIIVVGSAMLIVSSIYGYLNWRTDTYEAITSSITEH